MSQSLNALKGKQFEYFTTMAAILSGLASPTRVRLLHFLSQGDFNVETLSKKIDQSVANTSMHLRKMLAENIVRVSTQGQKRIYQLNPAALAFWESCQDFAQLVNPSLDLDKENSDINWQEDLIKTLNMAKKGRLIFLDARPHDEPTPPGLNELHILKIPSSEIEKKIEIIPKNKTVLVFCRGRFCALSAWTVQELRKHGVQAFRLNSSWYALTKIPKEV